MPDAKYLKVTTTALYVVEMIDSERTMVNGWPMETVINDWFHRKDRHDINGNHAARDGAFVGNTIKIKSIEVIDDIDAYMGEK